MTLTRKRRFSFLVLTVVASLLTAPVLFADDDDDDGGGTTATAANRCVVKFVCGEVLESIDRIVGGSYRTAINVLNAGTDPVNYTKKAALTAPAGEGFEGPGDSLGPIGPFQLGMMLAFDIDCEEIFDEFGADEEEFAEGFVILESDGPLDVTAVYTASGGDGVSSIDVEPVTCTQSAVKSSSDDDDDD